MTAAEVEAVWDKPIRHGITVCIYHHDDRYLIAAYGAIDAESRIPRISDYVIIDADRTYIEGTIPVSCTIDYVMDELSHNMSGMIQTAYDNGSGTTIYTVMTSDGYMVEWYTEDAGSYWFLAGGDCRIIDAITTDHASYSFDTPVSFFVKRFFQAE